MGSDSEHVETSRPMQTHVQAEQMFDGSCTSSKNFPRLMRYLVYIYIYFYLRTMSALPHDFLPMLEPGTRSRISARFMAPGLESPRARQGGVPRAKGRSPHPSGDVCAEPFVLEGSPETRGVPSSGLGPPRTERVRGVASVGRSESGEVL